MAVSEEQVRVAFGPLVGRTARLWRRAVDINVHPFGLTEATWRPLIAISRANGPMRQKDLAAALTLDGSSVVRLLDSLQAAGLIERREGLDRRAKEIHLTDLGRTRVAHVERASGKIRGRALAGVSAADLDTVFRVLTHICDTLSEMADEVVEDQAG